MDGLKVQVNGEVMVVPGGVDLLGEGDLYSVDFSLLQLSDDVSDNDVGKYKWYNPRHLGKKSDMDAAGLGKLDMVSLLNDIKEEGLLSPLICRWLVEDTGLSVQVLDGERRWRCVDKLIAMEESVWSRCNKKWLPAPEVYKKVGCRIVTGNDKEALKIAFMVSDRSVNWGEAAVAKLIRRLRSCGCDDDEILETTKKSAQWLREQDRICALDEVTFSYLTDGKINRALALKLADIEDIDRCHLHLRAAYDDAVALCQDGIKKAEQDLAKAVEKEEYIEAKLEETLVKGEDTAEVHAKLAEAHERSNQKRQARSVASSPKAKTANLRHARFKLVEAGEEIADDVNQVLSPGAIQKQLESIQAVITAGGKDRDNKNVLDVQTLRACEVCYKAILHGDVDVIRLLKRHRAATILTQRHLSMKTEDLKSHETEDLKLHDLKSHETEDLKLHETEDLSEE